MLENLWRTTLPFNPHTYGIYVNSHLKTALDTAIERENGVFIPTADKNEAMTMRMDIGKFRKAVEAQNGDFKYVYVRMDCEQTDDGTWGIRLTDQPKPDLVMLDPETGKLI